MSMTSREEILNSLGEDWQTIRNNWGWFLAMGIVLLVLGTLAIGVPYIVGLTAMVAFGILLAVGGVIELVSSFWARQWSGFFGHLLTGILYVIVGLLMIDHPLAAESGLTLMIAALLMITGLARVFLALFHRFHNRGWVLLSGFISFVLGVMIWREWPYSGLWVIGLFIGIEMIFNGWTWVMVALAVRTDRPPQTSV